MLTQNRRYEHFSHVSSPDYFLQLLDLQAVDWLRVPIIQGIATSAVAGAEGVIRSTRSALVRWINSQEPRDQQVLLVSVIKVLLIVLSDNLQDDRYAIPAMELLAFLLDGYILSIPENSEPRLAPDPCPLQMTRQPLTHIPSFRKLFVLVQKAHFKTSNIARLEAAIRVYACLSRLEPLRLEVLKKLTAMLLHPFPRVCTGLAIARTSADFNQVRSNVAEYLFMETGSNDVKCEDWTRQPKELKGLVGGIRETLEL